MAVLNLKSALPTHTVLILCYTSTAVQKSKYQSTDKLRMYVYK